MSRTFFEIEPRDIFNDSMPLTMQTQLKKKNNGNYIKLKKFSVTKERMTRIKREPMDWEKITHKVLISNVYTLSQTDGLQAYVKMFFITYHWENANQHNNPQNRIHYW